MNVFICLSDNYIMEMKTVLKLQQDHDDKLMTRRKEIKGKAAAAAKSSTDVQKQEVRRPM